MIENCMNEGLTVKEMYGMHVLCLLPFCICVIFIMDYETPSLSCFLLCSHVDIYK